MLHVFVVTRCAHLESPLIYFEEKQREQRKRASYRFRVAKPFEYGNGISVEEAPAKDACLRAGLLGNEGTPRTSGDRPRHLPLNNS